MSSHLSQAIMSSHALSALTQTLRCLVKKFALADVSCNALRALRAMSSGLTEISQLGFAFSQSVGSV